MRFSVLSTVFVKELRELMRDRRSLLVMFGVPLVVYPLLFAGIGALAKGKIEQQRAYIAKIIVENGGAAPELMRRLQLPESKFDIRAETANDGKLQRGDIDAVLTVPLEAEKQLLEVQAAATKPSTQATLPSNAEELEIESTIPPAGPQFKIRFDRSRGESDGTASRLKSLLTGYERWILEHRLEERNVPPGILAPLATATIDIATQDQRLGRFLAQLLPLLLLITGMLGAFFPALNATTTERELGTLETLLVSPVSRSELLLAKGILVLCCSILTAGMNMVSMSAVFTNMAAQSKEAFGAVSINPTSLVLAFVATIPTLVLFSAIVMCVGMIARTYREANSFAAPVMMMPMAAMAIGMADPVTTKALLATPIANTTIIIRDILTARVTAGNFMIAAGSNLLFAAVVLSIAARLFTNEQLVNPAWEPLSLKGFKRGKGPRRLRWPTVDEALILIAVGVLLQFYVGPWLGKLFTEGRINAPTLIAILMAGSFLAPAILLAKIGRYPWRDVFSVRIPPVLGVVAAILLGVGLMPLSMGYGELQRYFLPAEPSDSAKSVAKLIGASFDISPVLAAVIFGVLPGICEEVVFRGVVLSSLRKRLSVHGAVWITGLLFALIHMDFAGMLPRTILGAMLGYITVWTGSIFPAMLLHAAFNSSQIGLFAYYLPTSFASTQPADEAIPEALKPLSTATFLRLTFGLISVGLGMVALKFLPKRDTRIQPL